MARLSVASSRSARASSGAVGLGGMAPRLVRVFDPRIARRPRSSRLAVKRGRVTTDGDHHARLAGAGERLCESRSNKQRSSKASEQTTRGKAHAPAILSRLAMLFPHRWRVASSMARLLPPPPSARPEPNPPTDAIRIGRGNAREGQGPSQGPFAGPSEGPSEGPLAVPGRFATVALFCLLSMGFLAWRILRETYVCCFSAPVPSSVS